MSSHIKLISLKLEDALVDALKSADFSQVIDHVVHEVIHSDAVQSESDRNASLLRQNEKLATQLSSANQQLCDLSLLLQYLLPGCDIQTLTNDVQNGQHDEEIHGSDTIVAFKSKLTAIEAARHNFDKLACYAAEKLNTDKEGLMFDVEEWHMSEGL
jgi:hypothetical protein